MWAITVGNIGKKVSARQIREGWSLAPGETFIINTWNASLVLDESGVALRQKTQAELDAPDISTLKMKAIQAELEIILTNGTTAETIAYKAAVSP